MKFFAAAMDMMRRAWSSTEWPLLTLPLKTLPLIKMPCLPYVPDFSAGDISWLLSGDPCAESKKPEAEQFNENAINNVSSRGRSHQT